jgi:nucleotide-binding universal stress UspA family protein
MRRGGLHGGVTVYRRIVLALDRGEPGAVATAYSLALARHCSASVHVVHVDTHLRGGRRLSTESHDESVRLVGSSMRLLHDAGIRATGVTYRTTRFDVAETIADAAARISADVVVCGSPRRRVVRSHRSVHRALLRLSAMPILFAPPPLEIPRSIEVAPSAAAAPRSGQRPRATRQ